MAATSPTCKVTLAATDNDGGSGVDYTEYRLAGAARGRAYSAPFDVTERRHARRSSTARSTRPATPRRPARSAFKIDKAAPTTTAKLNGEAPKANYDGPVAVDLDATDADLGRREDRDPRRRRRVEAVREEETILNSAADLAKWAQAGAGGLNWVDDATAGSPARPGASACRGTRSRTTATSR